MSKERKEYETIWSKHKRREFRRRKLHKAQSKKEAAQEIEDWYRYFMKSEESENILSKNNKEVFLKCEELKIQRQENSIETDKDKIPEEECECEYSVECKYCNSVYENEKGLLEHFSETEEDKAAEMKEYKDMKNEQRREKYKEKVEKTKEPISALPERELCEYEKIREDNIEQREKEWPIYEAKWEAEWETNIGSISSL